MTDIRQHSNYAKYMKSKNWTTEEWNGVYYYIKKILFFSLMKIQHPEKIDLNFVSKLVKKYRIIQVFIEPKTFKEADYLISKNWKIAFPFLPSKTVFVNLTEPENDIYEMMNKDTRYSIRKSEKVNVKEEKNYETLRKYWKAAVDFKRYVLSVKDMQDLKTSFGDDSLFLLADNGIAGGIFLRANEMGYYWYGFANSDGRKKMALYKVVWEGMKWAKKRNVKYFDMEGIYDDRFPIEAWRGFTRFKKGFGGEEVKFPGAYKKLFLPV